MASAKRRTKRASKRTARKPQGRAPRPGRGHNKPPAESDAPPPRTPPPMPRQPSEDQTTAQVARDTADHRRRLVAPVTGGMVGEGGPPFAAANDPPLVLRHAREVERAIHKLPPDAPLAKADRDKIRRALSVLTDGQVGGFKFKLKDPKAAKQTARQTLKHYAKIVGDKAAEQVGKRVGDAVVNVAIVALWEALKRLLGN